MKIPTHQLRCSVIRPLPKGGQQCGVIETEVLVQHMPSGLSASCKFARSQLKNRQTATEMIEYGLLALDWDQEQLDRLTPEAMAQICSDWITPPASAPTAQA